MGLLHRAGLPSPVPTLSRKRQGFSSKNTSIGGELWGSPQGGLVASKINLEVGTFRERPEEEAEGSHTGPLRQSQSISRKHTSLTYGHTEAQALRRRGEEPSYLPFCQGPGSRLSALQNKGTDGEGERDSHHPASASAKPLVCVPGPDMPSEGGGGCWGKGRPKSLDDLGKVIFLLCASAASPVKKDSSFLLATEGHKRDASNYSAAPLANPRKHSAVLHLPDTLTTLGSPGLGGKLLGGRRQEEGQGAGCVLLWDVVWKQILKGTQKSEGRKLRGPFLWTLSCSFQIRGSLGSHSPAPCRTNFHSPCGPCPLTPLRSLLHCPPIPSAYRSTPTPPGTPLCFHSRPGTSFNLPFPSIFLELLPIHLWPPPTSPPQGY